MSLGLLGTKVGMTREFLKNGQSVPVTVIRVEKGRVLDVITKETRGYSAVKVGFFSIKNSKLTNQMKGYFTKKNTEPKKILKEFRLDKTEEIKEGNEIEMKDVSDHLADVSSRDFYQYASEAYELEDSFPADRGAVRKLTKYVGQGGGLSVSFDQKLMGERIRYDAKTDTLTIVGIPPNLREQLTRRANTDDEQV